MEQINNTKILSNRIESIKGKNTVILIPTMGALHEGHLSLVRYAKNISNSIIVVSIFVNPLQFNDPNDFKKYPVNLEQDLELLKSLNIDIVYTPSTKEIYPTDTTTKIKAGPLSIPLEGVFRPGHFDGVVTVVSILFDNVKPNISLFGEKDFQQVRVIEEFVSELQLPIKIITVPIVRDLSGLALSSRNSRLSEDGKLKALNLYNSLLISKNTFHKTYKVSEAKEEALKFLNDHSSDLTLEYFEIIDETTLLSANETTDRSKLRSVVAAYVEGVRLIDTLSLT